MKTLEEMLAYTRRKLRDAVETAEMWDDGTVMDEMTAAWDKVRRDLASSPAGRASVLAYQDAQSLVADQEIYSLPPDCLQVHDVQWRAGSDYDWMRVPFVKPPSGGCPKIGTAAMLGLSQPASVASGMGWFDDVDPGSIRIWPAQGVVSGEEFRLRYVPRIPFPSDTSGTLRDPDATGSDVYRLPDRIDMALCYLTAHMLSLEELEEGKSVGAFGSLYASIMRDVLADGRVLRPRTRHIGDY